jgi:CheY-like chemotaxis protein
VNPNQYHSVLVALDQALLVFQHAGAEFSAEDKQLLWQLEVFRSQVLKAESGHPFPEAPPPLDFRALQPKRTQPAPEAVKLEAAVETWSKRIRVVIADDHASVRTTLRYLLSGEGDVDVVAEVTNGREAVEMVSASQPDLVIMDLNMPVLDGISATREALRASPDSKVLVFSANRDPAAVQRAADAGAAGYIFKPGTRQILMNAVRALQQGQTAFPNCAELPAPCRSGLTAGLPSFETLLKSVFESKGRNAGARDRYRKVTSTCSPGRSVSPAGRANWIRRPGSGS